MNNKLTPLARLRLGNKLYLKGGSKFDISPERRRLTAEEGQNPYAIIVTCSDSRVPPEYIFSADIGDLFVIRTAGNVVGDLELGSIEYGVQHLGAELVVILGHTCCGAIAAALKGHSDGEGHISALLDEIIPNIDPASDPTRCSEMNVLHSVNKVKTSFALKYAEVVGAIYDITTGQVNFLETSI